MPRLPPGSQGSPSLPLGPTPPRGLVWAWIVGSLALVAGLFWHQDWRYSQPTPRPPWLEPPTLGTRVGPPPGWAGHRDRALLLHVYNPECPCSRFAEEHLLGLATRFAGQLDVVLLVQGDADAVESRRALAHLPRIADPLGQVAAFYGAWSTPTAVLLDRSGTLVFRGNYNASRYCVDPKREFVRLALEGLMGPGEAAPPIVAPAPYGCPLPGHEGFQSAVRPGVQG